MDDAADPYASLIDGSMKLSFRQVGIHAREARKHPRTDSEEASVGIRLLANVRIYIDI